MEPSEHDRLRSVGERIDALRRAREPQRSRASDEFSNASYAWRMVTELVVGVLIGVGVGYGLDVLTGWAPLFLLVFGGLGFAAGIKVLMRTAEEMNRRGSGAAPPGRGDGDEHG